MKVRSSPRVLFALALAAGLLAPRALTAQAEPFESQPPESPSAQSPSSQAQPFADEGAEDTAVEEALRVDWGLEAKIHFRDSEDTVFPLIIPGGPNPGDGTIQTQLSTVAPGQHFEISVVTLYFTAGWGRAVEAHAKIDVIDSHDRNPTSEDQRVDVDEAWIRFGRAWVPGILPERGGAYVKVGKMPKFERQNDRHLESYGLVSTSFNRFEDMGLELGVDLGRHFYLRGSLTQGNPVFMRDPNALAGDNGTEASLGIDPLGNQVPLGSGIVVLYDAEVEDLDTDGDLEVGLGAGIRFGDESGNRGFELLAYRYQRELAETVKLNGTLYGGDLDLLRGPFNVLGLTLDGNDKEEVGANVWVYFDGFTFFGQYVDQDLAGAKRSGYEGEVAWSFDLPLRWAVGGRQLFPSIAPAVRYSTLDPEFSTPRMFPAPSWSWQWDKIDYGVRVGILPRVDLTIEYADNEFQTARGAMSNNELLTTLRFRAGDG